MRFGHRCIQDASENTITSLHTLHASHPGAACEVDTWRLGDGAYVLVHDPTWRRTIDPATIPAGTPARVAESTWDQVSRMRTYSGDPVPLLDPFLSEADDLGVPVLVEVKNTAPVAILTKHPATTAYVQVNGSCTSKALTQMVEAGITAGTKATDSCPLGGKALARMGASFTAQNTATLRADHGRFVTRLRRHGVEPLGKFVGTTNQYRWFNRHDVPFIRPYRGGTT